MNRAHLLVVEPSAQQLDRDRALHLRVVRRVDDTHPALADFFEDFETPDVSGIRHPSARRRLDVSR
jgi:hypothetical protein